MSVANATHIMSDGVREPGHGVIFLRELQLPRVCDLHIHGLDRYE
jgi:hypothetical protein